jgi:signal transduction histidine kinase
VLLAKTLRSSTFRLALLAIVVFGAVVIGLFGYVYWSTTRFVLSRSDAAIEAMRDGLRTAHNAGGRDSLIRAIESQVTATPTQLHGDLYLLVDAASAPVAGNLKVWPLEASGAEGWTEFHAATLNPKSPGERSLFRAHWETLSDGYRLLVGKDIGDLDRFAHQIYAAFALAIILVLVLAAVASVSVTRRTVGRIEAINATSRGIMDSGLGKRIPLRGTHDEWDQLADNLNSMLGRIEALMGEVKQVSDNVAHDLRTPLTRMRGRLENAFVAQRNPDHDQALISDTIADLDDVLRMFSALTRISQIETPGRTAAFRLIDLAQIAREVAELFDAAAEVRNINLKVVADRPVPVTGDRDLLFDAVTNLVDNAIKYGKDSGKVVVGVGARDGFAVVSVADNGPGIPGEERTNVFKRFYRLESSRCTPGNGLGLSLVSAVIRLHGASIELLDNSPGLNAEIRLPISSSE